jgi:ATP-dependent DNA helicase DinG
VDLPGSSLEILVIVRIPFDVPTDPVIEARMEEAEKRFGSGFLNYSVPEAVVRFRQGFGRLIRSAQDRGVVLLLDQRAVKSQYGKVFLSSLPVEPVACDSDDEVMDRIRKWF